MQSKDASKVARHFSARSSTRICSKFFANKLSCFVVVAFAPSSIAFSEPWTLDSLEQFPPPPICPRSVWRCTRIYWILHMKLCARDCLIGSIHLNLNGMQCGMVCADDFWCCCCSWCLISSLVLAVYNIFRCHGLHGLLIEPNQLNWIESMKVNWYSFSFHLFPAKSTSPSWPVGVVLQ